MLRPIGLRLIPLLLAAFTVASDSRTAVSQSAQCNSAKAQTLRGQHYSEALAAAARQLTGASIIRVVKPGQPITMDFMSNRANVEIDAAGFVRDVRCG
jgi:hypothetical protein